jgi:hypothetical protein
VTFKEQQTSLEILKAPAEPRNSRYQSFVFTRSSYRSSRHFREPIYKQRAPRADLRCIRIPQPYQTKFDSEKEARNISGKVIGCSDTAGACLLM